MTGPRSYGPANQNAAAIPRRRLKLPETNRFRRVGGRPNTGERWAVKELLDRVLGKVAQVPEPMPECEEPASIKFVFEESEPDE